MDALFSVMNLAKNVGGFATGRSVSHGDGLNIIFVGYLFEMSLGCIPVSFGWKGIGYIVIEQISLCVEAYYFASGSYAGIHAHYAFLP